MSDLKMTDENTERQKGSIIKFVRKNHREGHETGGSEILEYCINEMKIKKTTAKKLIRELEKKNKLYCVDIHNNEKYYYPTDYLCIPKGSFIVKGETGNLEILDKEFEKIKARYADSNRLEKTLLVYRMFEKIFRHVNGLILSGSISKPTDIFQRTMIIKYQKLIHRLHQIVDNPSDPDRNAIAMVFILFPKVSQKEFFEFITKEFVTHADENPAGNSKTNQK